MVAREENWQPKVQGLIGRDLGRINFFVGKWGKIGASAGNSAGSDFLEKKKGLDFYI